jgi:hypothetical protein
LFMIRDKKVVGVFIVRCRAIPNLGTNNFISILIKKRKNKTAFQILVKRIITK